jgi:hypothetical protein
MPLPRQVTARVWLKGHRGRFPHATLIVGQKSSHADVRHARAPQCRAAAFARKQLKEKSGQPHMLARVSSVFCKQLAHCVPKPMRVAGSCAGFADGVWSTSSTRSTR